MRRSAIVILLLAGVVAGLVVASQRGGHMAWVAVAIVATVVVSAIIAITAAHRRRKPGGEKVTAEQLGLHYEHRSQRPLHVEHAPLPRVPHSGKTLQVLRGSLDERELVIFQHQYVVSTGQGTFPVDHAIYITSSPEWPLTTIAPRSPIGRLLFKLGRRSGIQLEDQTFNHAFHVKSEDEDFAVTLLTPELQSLLLEHRGITWHAHPGVLAMMYKGRLRLDRVESSLERMRRFWGLVPVELEAW